MQPIISPVDKTLLKKELTPDRRLRTTNKAGNEIYIITYQQAPNVMREIGRLREIAFRAAGGGTGMELDWDEFDTCEHPYYQLIVWDPEEELILGGYRFLPGSEANMMIRGNHVWLQVTCFTSLIISWKHIWLIRLSLGGRSLRLSIKAPEP